MSLRYPGHAKINPSFPSAIGCCDRCGFQWNLNELRFQYEYRGNALTNLQLLVCPPCYDIPAEFVRPIILGPDPIPVRNPRPDPNATPAEMGPTPEPIVFQAVD